MPGSDTPHLHQPVTNPSQAGWNQLTVYTPIEYLLLQPCRLCCAANTDHPNLRSCGVNAPAHGERKWTYPGAAGRPPTSGRGPYYVESRAVAGGRSGDADELQLADNPRAVDATEGARIVAFYPFDQAELGLPGAI